ncbi:MAG: EamA family transporter [SAR86 cluster bacterium]|uniref:EamA family transporter n=1 Tax=SAR86 cluster bacterium TaxID=2030880 RepID=A0A2A5C7I7_9GAMM|nr:MAG: EamA family transporter [SAR86 cluster bacterium]
MLLATFLFALMTVFVKLVPNIPVLEIIFFRAVFSIVVCLYSLIRARVPVFGNNKPILVLRGLAGVMALSLNYYLIQEVPLAAASTLTYLAPIFTTVLGIFFVKEKISPLQFAFFALSFSGILVIQGFDNRISLFHLLVGISTSMLMGLAYNCVRKLSTTEHPVVIMFYFPLLCLPVTGFWIIFNWTMPEGREWLYLAMVSLTSQVAQYYLTRAYQISEIASVSIVSYTSIIYTIVLGLIIFGESFNSMTYLGMALVIAGVAANVLWKSRSRKVYTAA